MEIIFYFVSVGFSVESGFQFHSEFDFFPLSRGNSKLVCATLLAGNLGRG